MSMSSYFLLLAWFMLLLNETICFPGFRDEIPNGYNVPHPCSPSITWAGVGHQRSDGSGQLNNFGKDFLASYRKWWDDFCRKDSDNDGRTNGEELGDPNCNWQFGSPLATSANITHPGICEPIDSLHCRQQPHNKFLEELDICSGKLREQQPWCLSVSQDPAVRSQELRFADIEINSTDANYLCKAFALPSDQDYHIIAWESLIDNPDTLRSISLFTCNSFEEEQGLIDAGGYLQPQNCERPSNACVDMAIVWKHGQDLVRCYADDCGIFMGKSGFRRAILMLEYSQLLTPIRDSSGIRIYYTPKLRENSMSLLLLGQQHFAIPPQSPETVVTSSAFTTEDCSNDILGTQRYALSSVLFHMNQLGRYARMTIRRANGSIETLIDSNFTYDSPEYHVWPNDGNAAPYIEAGDNIEMECTFSSIGVSTATFYGPSNSDEVCYAFVEIVGRPNNSSFIGLVNEDNLNRCVWAKWNRSDDLVVDGCSFRNISADWNRLAAYQGGGWLEQCSTQYYPAETCSPGCLRTIERSTLGADNLCLTGSLMKFLTTLSVPSLESVFSILSEIEFCTAKTTTTSTTTTTTTSTLLPSTTMPTSVVKEKEETSYNITFDISFNIGGSSWNHVFTTKISSDAKLRLTFSDFV